MRTAPSLLRSYRQHTLSQPWSAHQTESQCPLHKDHCIYTIVHKYWLHNSLNGSVCVCTQDFYCFTRPQGPAHAFGKGEQSSRIGDSYKSTPLFRPLYGPLRLAHHPLPSPPIHHTCDITTSPTLQPLCPQLPVLIPPHCPTHHI